MMDQRILSWIMAACFDALTAPIYPKLLRRAESLCYDFCVFQVEAGDIVNEALAIVWQRLEVFDPEKAEDLYPWTAGVMANVARNKGKRARKEQALLTPEGRLFAETNGLVRSVEDMLDDPTRVYAENDRWKENLRNQVARLPKRQRQVFLAMTLWRRSGKETAVIQNLCVKTVWSHYRHARTRLRKRVGNASRPQVR